jgi:GNAT superfamily N-acetyltransferase
MILHSGYAPGCIGRIAEMHADYYHPLVGFGVEFEAKVASELSAFCLGYAAERDGLWLASTDSGVQASVAIAGPRPGQEMAQLRWFIASPAMRGTGIGGRLLRAAMQFCDDKSYPEVHLWTFAGLDAARHLYDLHGFRLVEERPGVQWGAEVLEQRFVRSAGGARKAGG